MDYFTKKRLAIWGIVLLVVMNISALATVWYQQHRRPTPPLPGIVHPEAAHRFLHRELHLSDAQTEQLSVLLRKHFERARAIQGEIRDLKFDIINELAATPPDTIHLNRLAAEIGDKQAKLEKETYFHFLELKALCSREQQEKLHDIFGKMQNRMAPQHRVRRRRVGPPPGGNRHRPPRRELR
ncbi:MAG: periplasmic heavy metal sensor [bacterium]